MLSAFQKPGYLFLFTLLALLFAPSQLYAHKLTPSVIDITYGKSQTFSLEIDANLEAILSGIGPEHRETGESPLAEVYNRLRETPPDELEALFRNDLQDFLGGISVVVNEEATALTLNTITIPGVGDIRQARRSKLVLSGIFPGAADSVQFRFKREYGDAVLRIHAPGQEKVTHWLTGGKISPAFDIKQPELGQSAWQTVVQYIKLGFTHILPLGLDHILFVLGLFLLSLHLRPVLWQVTAFTVAHTITLALTILGYIELPDSIVEPLIAASIVYIGVENILTKEIHWHRIIIIFLFGLLHGMGFAGVLHELGLPEGQLASALISFNVGVELGQLAVILLAFVAVGIWFRHKSWYRKGIVIPFSLLIAVTGLYWFIERIS